MLTHVGPAGQVIRIARRLPPRPDHVGGRRLGHPRLRGRAGPLARRAAAQALAAPRRRGDAAVVRVRRECSASSCAAPSRRRAGRSEARDAVPRGLLRDRRPVAAAAGQAAIERLLAVFELEKAVYELRYELDNRPDWVRIPVAGIQRLIEQSAAESCDRARRRPARRAGRARVERRRRRARVPPGGAGGARAAGGRRGDADGPGRAVGGAAAEGAAAARLRARGRLPGRQHVHAPRSVRVPADARRARPAPRARGTARAALREARRARARDRRRRRHRVRGVGAERSRRVASSATSTAGTAACTRCARSARPASGSCSCPASAPGATYKYEIHTQAGRLRLKADPLAFHTEVPPRTASVVFTSKHEWARRRVARARGRRATPARADVDLRGAPRLVAAQPARGEPAAHLPRARRGARRLRRRPRLHARRADAGDGAPVRGLVGLPGHRLLRADRRASAPRTTSARSSTRCTGAASA